MQLQISIFINNNKNKLGFKVQLRRIRKYGRSFKSTSLTVEGFDSYSASILFP